MRGQVHIYTVHIYLSPHIYGLVQYAYPLPYMYTQIPAPCTFAGLSTNIYCLFKYTFTLPYMHTHKYTHTSHWCSSKAYRRCGHLIGLFCHFARSLLTYLALVLFQGLDELKDEIVGNDISNFEVLVLWRIYQHLYRV